jgi:hypothetical protein
MYSNEEIHCRLVNLSSQGMFVLTENTIELGKEVQFNCYFKSNNSNGPMLKGEGFIARSHKNGLAVKFTNIDFNILQKCIFWMIDNE